MIKTIEKKQVAKASGRLRRIVNTLEKIYPDVSCALYHDNAWQLLMATILSAQCTDARVNQVTPVLFKKYPTARALAKARLPDVESIVRSTGFFRQKSKSLVSTSKDIVDNYDGVVPNNIEALLKLRGVARKTANVVLGNAYGISSGVVVDTHVMRLSQRMGFTKHKEPVKIEKDLMAFLAQNRWIWFSHAMITHGRRVCKAQSPNCAQCPVKTFCSFFRRQAPGVRRHD